MALKICILAALVAISQAVVIGAPAAYPYGPAIGHGYGPAIGHGYGPVGYPAIAKVAAPVADHYDPNPQYSFSYDVHDAITGDAKSQQESRSGDVVQGSYSLIEPDGTRRIVEYTADPVHGFNAVVHKEPVAVKAIAPIAKIIAPIAKIASPYPGLYHH